MEDFRLDGLVAATFTPMKENGDVDYDKIEDHCQFLSDEGVKQVFINGSTGECSSLTTEESMRIAECWMKAGKKNNRMSATIVHVGGRSLRDSIALAKHAESLGADAISTLPPLYFPVSTTQDLVDHCRTVAAAAPNTPMYYYHIPIRSGVFLDMEQFLLDARDVIPTLRGIKFTHDDLVQMSACLRTKDAKGRNFNILFGSDTKWIICPHGVVKCYKDSMDTNLQLMISAWTLGADGFIGTTYSFMSGLYRRLLAFMDKGDLKAACAEQYRSHDVVKQVYKFGEKTNGSITPCKAVMSLIGLDVGPAREPFRDFETKDKEAFFKALTDLGFLDWRKE